MWLFWGGDTFQIVISSISKYS